jgi:hypothetical protein
VLRTGETLDTGFLERLAGLVATGASAAPYGPSP